MTPLALSDVEQKSAWLKISIPLRVLRFDLDNFKSGGFSEDTHTLFVNHYGASVTLRHPVGVDDFLRVVNLVNHREADFRVVGAMGGPEDGAVTWGMERADLKADFWGVECPPATQDHGPVLLQCRICGAKANRSLSFMEFEVFSSAGMIILNCDACARPTYWMDADPDRGPHDFSAVEAIAHPPLPSEPGKTKGEKVERRASKRSGLKLPALVRNEAGDQELSKTAGISKSGACISLFMALEVGATVRMICPYDPRSVGIEQAAEVCWRSTHYTPDFPRTYGVRFIR